MAVNAEYQEGISIDAASRHIGEEAVASARRKAFSSRTTFLTELKKGDVLLTYLEELNELEERRVPEVVANKALHYLYEYAVDVNDEAPLGEEQAEGDAAPKAKAASAKKKPTTAADVAAMTPTQVMDLVFEAQEGLMISKRKLEAKRLANN